MSELSVIALGSGRTSDTMLCTAASAAKRDINWARDRQALWNAAEARSASTGLHQAAEPSSTALAVTSALNVA
jgi:hypothetical protein